MQFRDKLVFPVFFLADRIPTEDPQVSKDRGGIGDRESKDESDQEKEDAGSSERAGQKEVEQCGKEASVYGLDTDHDGVEERQPFIHKEVIRVEQKE